MFGSEIGLARVQAYRWCSGVPMGWYATSRTPYPRDNLMHGADDSALSKRNQKMRFP